MNQFDLIEILAKLGMFFVPFLFALCFHEFAHGLVAKWRGDNTAQMMGRLTMNPVAHADPLGTWVLPIAALALNSLFFSGWEKPGPGKAENQKRPRKDMLGVALAGPASNILLALLGMFALAFVYAHFRGGQGGAAYVQLLQSFLLVNLFLALFNLIPIHPLDGGKVLAPFLPASWNIWLEQNQSMLNMGLLVFLLLAGRVLAAPVYYLVDMLQRMALSLSGIM